MRVQRVIAAVSDIDRAEVWFTDLFGTGPDARPMEGLIEWHFGAAAISRSPPTLSGPAGRW